MVFISGLLVALLAIIFSVVHLGQSFSNYIDPVGLAVVIGGTIAVAIIITPWDIQLDIRRALIKLFSNEKIDFRAVNEECLAFIQANRQGMGRYTPRHPGEIGKLLTEGAELISLGFEKEKIRTILEEHIFQTVDRRQRVANSLRALAKYPPAFGLVGTVLGLVSLMNAISAGASSTEAGRRMAVALVATLYGLLLANLVLNPAGENVLKATNDERRAMELVLEAVLLAASDASMLESQEMLNARLAPTDRVHQLAQAGAEA
ncbi:MAG: motility protein A [Oligoflexia bacterium]